MLGNLVTVSLAGKPLDNAIVWFLGANLVAIFFLIAGIRLWRRAGWIWGSVAALLLLIELAVALVAPTVVTNAYAPLVARLTSFTSMAAKAGLIASFVVKFALFALVSNGVRGALALRNLDYGHPLRDVFG